MKNMKLMKINKMIKIIKISYNLNIILYISFQVGIITIIIYKQ